MHVLTPADDLLSINEVVVYGDAGYQCFSKSHEMAGMTRMLRFPILLGKRHSLMDKPYGRL